MPNTDMSSLEEFKRAHAAAFRAVAGRPQAVVDYAGGAVAAKERETGAVLPAPTADLSEGDVRLARGEADSLAVRLRHHDAALHQSRRPGGGVAPLLFDALENARLEAVGGRWMDGLRHNVAASLEQYFRRQGWHRMEDAAAAEHVLPDVVRLLARESLSGEAPPDTALPVVAQWRMRLADFARRLDGLSPLLEDQEAYAAAVNQLIQDMDVGAEPPADDTEERQDEAEDEQADQQSRQGDDESNAAAQQDGTGEADDGAGEQGLGEEAEPAEDGREQRAEQESEEQMDSRPQPPIGHNLEGLPKDEYRAFTLGHDEVVRAEDLCEAEELALLRRGLDKELAHSPGPDRAAGQSFAAAAAGPAAPVLGL